MPCAIRGGREAVLGGQGPTGHYGLHLKGASHWTLSGFTVVNASKGIVLDAPSHDMLDGVEVKNIGAEGIHLRSFSSDDAVRHSVVHNTGKSSPQYGEGIYVGSAMRTGGRARAASRTRPTATRSPGTASGRPAPRASGCAMRGGRRTVA
ncbi:MAG TPA: hypothetical protein VKB14_19295 [Actinomycetales bacterium]|nr:hypothetical protein [Actinomycetales bacterium]